MNTLEVLKEARELLSVETRWTKFATARNRPGTSSPPSSGGAVCWSANGALQRVCSPSDRWMPEELSLWHRSMNYLEESLPDSPTFTSVDGFNDHLSTTHADVLALFNRTIERLEVQKWI